MRKAGLAILMAGCCVPVAAAAQTPPTAATLKAIEAKVRPQSWYPEGYYDIRIAAEGQIAEVPRKKSEIIFDWEDGKGKRYDIIDCGAEPINPEGDMLLARYGFIAVDISRLRYEFEMLGYPAAVYAEPLAAFERARIEEAAKLSDREVRIASGEDIVGDDEPPPPDAAVAEDSSDEIFVTAIEANRVRLAPKLPSVVIEGGCGAGEGGPIIVRTTPPGGEVLLINAFGFKVCTRKLADPWDRFKCRWNEVETGVERNNLSGRYVFQIKWPDGTVRKGTRDITPDYENETATTVTFKKVGS